MSVKLCRGRQRRKVNSELFLQLNGDSQEIYYHVKLFLERVDAIIMRYREYTNFNGGLNSKVKLSL